VGTDVFVCVQAGKDGFLGDCGMLNLTERAVCRGIIKASVGCEDALVCNSLRPAEGFGWRDGCWIGRMVILQSWRHIR
jgi:hypothetical protein